MLPGDEELDIVGTSFSPGVRRMMGRMGGKESFNEARWDIAEMAGIQVETKAVERVPEAIGSQLEVLTNLSHTPTVRNGGRSLVSTHQTNHQTNSTETVFAQSLKRCVAR